MINFTLPESQLYKMLCRVFGAERVIPQMSVLAVCGGKLPEQATEELHEWASTSKCLFTIIDQEGDSKLVVEFGGEFTDTVDVKTEQHARLLPPLLKIYGIQYAALEVDEFSQLLDPQSSVDLTAVLCSKVGVDLHEDQPQAEEVTAELKKKTQKPFMPNRSKGWFFS